MGKHSPGPADVKASLEQAVHETDDSIRVLTEAGLHLDAVSHLQEARRLISRHGLGAQAIAELKLARDLLVEPT